MPYFADATIARGNVKKEKKEKEFQFSLQNSK
jgi:hypothetical protein